MTDLLGGGGAAAPSGGTDLLGGGGSSGAPASGTDLLGSLGVGGATATPAPTKKNQGGFMGFLGRAAKDAESLVNPVNVVEGLAKSGFDTARNAVDIAGGAINGGVPAHLRPSYVDPKTGKAAKGWVPFLQKALPFVGGIVGGVRDTGVDLLGGAQGAAGIAGNALGPAGGPTANAPLGKGFRHEAEQGFYQHPGFRGFNDVVNAAVAASAGSGAAGLAADVLPEGATADALRAAAEGLGTGGKALGHVAGAPFLPLKAVGAIPFGYGTLSDAVRSNLETAGGKLAESRVGQATGRSIERMKTMPLIERVRIRAGIPYANEEADLARHQAALEKVVSDPTEQQAALLGPIYHGRPEAAIAYLNAIADPATRDAVQKFYDEQAAKVPQGARAEVSQTVEAHTLAAKAALGMVPQDVLGRLARADELLRGMSDVGQKHALEQGLHPEQTQGPFPMQHAVEEQVKPKVAARDQALRDQAILQQRAARLRGAVPEVEPRVGNLRIQGLLEKAKGVGAGEVKQKGLVGAAEAAKQAIGAKAGEGLGEQFHPAAFMEKAKEGLGEGAPKENIKALAQDYADEERAQHGDAVAEAAVNSSMAHVADALAQDAQAGGRNAFQALTSDEKKMYRAAVGGDLLGAKKADLLAARDQVTAVIAERGKKAGIVQGLAEQRARFAEQNANRATLRVAKTQEAFAKAVEDAQNSVKAAPAPFQRAMQPFVDLSEGLSKVAKDAEGRGDVVLAGHLADVADDFKTYGKLASFDPSFENPPHIIAMNSKRIQAVSDETMGQMRANRSAGFLDAMRARTPTALKEREQGIYAMSLKGQTDVATARLIEQSKSAAAFRLADQYGKTAEDHLGQAALVQSDRDNMAAMAQDKMVPWNPKTGIVRDPAMVHPDTAYLPESIAKAADGMMFRAIQKNGLLTGLDLGTKWLYRGTGLMLSPAYLAHRLGSAALIIATHPGMGLDDMIRYGTSATRDMLRGETPGSLRAGTLEEGASPVSRYYRAITTPTRVIDQFTKLAIFLKEQGDGVNPEEAAARAIEATGSLNSLGPHEQGVVRSLMPVYPLLRKVASVTMKLARDHPLQVALAMNMGEQAKALGEDGLPAFLQQFDPYRVFTRPPGGLINPVIRGLAGAGLGVKLSNLGRPGKSLDISQPNQHLGPPGLARGAYFFANQLPLGKLALESGLTGLSRGYDRYDTGDLRLTKGKPTKTTTPSYLSTFLGVPQTFPKAVPNPKTQKSKAKAVLKRSSEIQQANAQGIR